MATSTDSQAAKEEILLLLSDAETSKVSMAETKSLAAGDQYVDLDHLEAGVQTVGASGAPASRVIPRSAVGAETWEKIAARLRG